MHRLCNYFEALEAVIVVEIKLADSTNSTFADFEKASDREVLMTLSSHHVKV